ncbi:MAG: branched-chain amino acid aminotransferase [Rhodospirillales bacterium]|nr:branched-chain amino acid aminotransferase [Alphaproteobacteria bacterium]MCB9976064.1 branched-chain amino acid aminotransferase [Rhodospirillales bacterium]
MAFQPFDDRDGFIWINGKMLPWREAKIHVLSHGLHYASSVFEGERMYDGTIFKSLEHSMRLIRSAEILGMQVPLTPDQIEEIKYEVMEANGLKDGYVRPVAWRGGEQMGVSARKTKTHVAVAGWHWGTYYPEEKQVNGLRLKTAPWRRPAPDTAPTQSKAAGLYMICTMSKHAIEDEGYDDALMLDYRGYIAEASAANFFAVKDGVLLTPTPDCFLNGITRQTVMALAKDMGIKVEERHLKPEELSQFQEIFLTGTAAEITAVGEIDGQRFTVGPVTKRLKEAYQALVRQKPKKLVKAG